MEDWTGLGRPIASGIDGKTETELLPGVLNDKTFYAAGLRLTSCKSFDASDEFYLLSCGALTALNLRFTSAEPSLSSCALSFRFDGALIALTNDPLADLARH